MLDQTQIDNVATVTRNPATVRLVAANMRHVSPDLRSAQPLHRANDFEIRAITETYAEHTHSQGPLPIVLERYEAGGLYGGIDPGVAMPIPQIANDRSNAVIVAGKGRRYE